MLYLFFVSCPRGLEQVLVQELEEIARRPEVIRSASFSIKNVLPGGVQLAGQQAAAYAINLHSRIANRVLMQLQHSPYANEQDIYAVAERTPWEKYFDSTFTFRVDLTAQHSPLASLNFATLRIKDAICDRLRARYGDRPSVQTTAPDMRIYAHLTERDFTLYLDTSGEPLFKRGWRTQKGEAPIKENLAAGIVRLSGWQPQQTFFDPMCGSGTFLIEAAQMALGIPPGGARTFAFEKMKQVDLKLWHALREQALNQADRTVPLHIMGSDISTDMLTLTRANWQRAGLPGMIELKQLDARFLKPVPTNFSETNTSATNPDAAGVMVLNPPYGERITVRGKGEQRRRGDSLSRLEKGHYGHQKTRFHQAEQESCAASNLREEDEATANEFAAAFASSLKQHFAGWQVYVLSGDLKFPRRMRLKESQRTPLFNGPIECRLFRFAMVAGSAR